MPENPSIVRANAYEEIIGIKMSKICRCGKEIRECVNYCSWECHIDEAKAAGGRVICPNGLPIVCIKANGDMLEHEHADHPDYKMRVFARYAGDDEPEDEFDLCNEDHGVIYYDDDIIFTLHECRYYMWSWSGHNMRGSGVEKNYKLEDWSLKQLAEYRKANG